MQHRKLQSVCRMLEVCCFFFLFLETVLFLILTILEVQEKALETCGCVTDFQLVQTALSLSFLHSYSKKAKGVLQS